MAGNALGSVSQPNLSICSATRALPLACRVGCVCSRGFVAFPGVQGIQGQQQKLLWHREPSPGQLAVVILYSGDAGLAAKSKPKAKKMCTESRISNKCTTELALNDGTSC